MSACANLTRINEVPGLAKTWGSIQEVFEEKRRIDQVLIKTRKGDAS
jgi:hypothetical protein